jgi:hypothetical protein
VGWDSSRIRLGFSFDMTWSTVGCGGVGSVGVAVGTKKGFSLACCSSAVGVAYG